MLLRFENVEPASGRSVAVVGDKVSVIGKPIQSSTAMLFNVLTQPATSDIFSGLGSSGSNVSLAELDSATFAITGFYAFSAAAANGDIARIEIICFPVAALSVEKIKYASIGDKTSNAPRSDREIRGTLRALALHCTTAGAQAALEGGAAVSPHFGTLPATLKASTENSYREFGGW